ncbi:hypothetical protein [Kribbella deserti]|uniref:Recombinase family protein n=1 Tax=Kribbella deserti TaxID=1926257 RepID=A0ABV6QS69_9ACTN
MGQKMLHCYYRQHFMMTAKERATVLTMFTEFAARNGLELGGIFSDSVETGSIGLGALRAALELDDVRLVAVPSLLHLDPLGDPDRVVAEFTDAGVAIAVADPSFDQGPARSTACDSSSQNRPLSRSPGVLLTTLRQRAGTPSKAGERARSRRAAPRSPIHPEKPMRASRAASLPPGGACFGGHRELVPSPRAAGRT